MIQRIQTVYLLIAIIGISLATATPIATANVDGVEEFSIRLSGIVQGKEVINDSWFHLPYLGLLLLTLLTLFLFKKRKQQVLIGRLNFLGQLIAMVGIIWKFSSLTEIDFNLSNSSEEISISYGIAFYSIIVSTAMVFLANIAIKRDEKLVSSLDRLR